MDKSLFLVIKYHFKQPTIIGSNAVNYVSKNLTKSLEGGGEVGGGGCSKQASDLLDNSLRPPPPNPGSAPVKQCSLSFSQQLKVRPPKCNNVKKTLLSCSKSLGSYKLKASTVKC